MIDNSEKRKIKKSVKRRTIELIVSIPFGICFAFLFWYIKLSVGMQLFLTVLCWGFIILIIEIIYYLIDKKIKTKKLNKPKRRDPFAD